MHSSCPLVVDQNAQTYNLQVLQHEMRHRCVRILGFCISATPADGVETSSLFTLSIFHPELSFPPQNFWERRTCIAGHIGCKCCWSVHIRHACWHCGSLASIHLPLSASYGGLLSHTYTRGKGGCRKVWGVYVGICI